MLAGGDGGGDDDLNWYLEEGEPPCDCPPPPPRFLVPPPPAPRCPAAGDAAPGSQLQFCALEPVGAEFTQTAFPSLPVIAVCSSVVLVAVLVASFLLWKHKRKVQNFLPCKSHHQGRCDMGGATGITYDDVLINHHPTRLPNHHHPSLTPDTNTLTPIELLDVKYGNYVQSHADPLTRANFVLPNGNGQPSAPAGSERSRHRSGQPRNHKKNHFHPIYEEVSATSDDNKGRSYDSDIEDSEGDEEGRTVGSEDEFAEDELSVAGEYPQSKPCSATSSLQGSTGGDLYPDAVTGSSERFCSDGSPLSEGNRLKGSFRALQEPMAAGKLTHSLERNKDGHPSNSFQAKQNYYLNKSMLGPDFTYPEGMLMDSCVSPSGHGDMGQPDAVVMGSSLNFIPALLQQQQLQQQLQQQQRSVPAYSRSATNSPPPYPAASTTPTRGAEGSGSREGLISALYNPAGRIPDALLRELAFKLPNPKSPMVAPMMGNAVAPMSSRSLPVPPSCRAGGSGVLFTVENPYPQPPPQSLSRTRSGSVTEFGSGGGYHHHQYPHHALSGGRPPTPPPPENIYASIDDVGPFTIDGSRHGSRFVPGRKNSADQRNTFGRRTSNKSSAGGSDKFQSANVPSRHPNGDEGGPYGDIRPIYDSRTACS